VAFGKIKHVINIITIYPKLVTKYALPKKEENIAELALANLLARLKIILAHLRKTSYSWKHI